MSWAACHSYVESFHTHTHTHTLSPQYPAFLPITCTPPQNNGLQEQVAGLIVECGGLERLAHAMALHPGDKKLQQSATDAVDYIAYTDPEFLATLRELGFIPLLRHAAGMGITEAPTVLARMGENV